MKCSILESCVAIVTKYKSSWGTPNLTFVVMKILLKSLKPRKQYLKMEVSVMSLSF